MPTDFAALVDDFLRAHWKLNPVAASVAGIHGYDDELGDFTRRGFRERDQFAKEWERRIAAIPDAQLEARQRIDRDVILAHLRGAVALAPFEAWARHAPLYPQAIALGAYALLVRDFAPLEDRLARIAARLARAPQLIAAAMANLDAERTAPVHVVVAGEVATAAATFARAYLPSLAPDGPVKRDLVLAGQEAAGSLERFAGWLRDDVMKRARGGIAIGRDALDALLRRQHLLADDAIGVLRVGREAYEETQARLVETAAEMGSEDWARLVEELKRDHPSADQVVEAYRREADRARDAVRALAIVPMPEPDELEVVETPEFRRPIVPYADYFGPAPFERGRKGTVLVTLPDARAPERDREQRLQGHARSAIPVFLVHEAYPGHHVQSVARAEHGSAVRKAFRTPFFDEGWALYSEELMRESDYFDQPAVRLMQLRALLVRAARVVVDVGLATGEMNFEQAVNFMTEGPKLEHPNAIAEVRRYTLSPTQPMSYLIGRQEILRLREAARAKGWGLRQFHERLLGVGSVAPRLARTELDL